MNNQPGTRYILLVTILGGETIPYKVNNETVEFLDLPAALGFKAAIEDAIRTVDIVQVDVRHRTDGNQKIILREYQFLE